EDDAVRGRRPLTRDREACDSDPPAVRVVAEISARDNLLRQPRSEERKRMRADREARQPVVGEHPLPGRLLGQLRRRGGRVERERQLARLPARAGNASGAKGEAELPEQLPPLPELVTGA